MKDHSVELVIDGYLECAASDRRAAHLLYENGQYPLAIYHLQQYVEKMSKCFMLEFEKCSIKEVYNCHDILEILKKEQIRIGVLDKKEEMKLIQWADELETLTSPNVDMFLGISEELFILCRTRLPEVIPGITEEQLSETSRYYATVTALVVLTRQHIMSTRYPAIKCDQRDFSEYDISSGIVKLFPFLLMHTEVIEKLIMEKMKTERVC